MVLWSQPTPKSFLARKLEKKLFMNKDKLSSLILGHISGIEGRIMAERVVDPVDSVETLTNTTSVFVGVACGTHFCFFLMQYRQGGPPSH